MNYNNLQEKKERGEENIGKSFFIPKGNTD